MKKAKNNKRNELSLDLLFDDKNVKVNRNFSYLIDDKIIPADYSDKFNNLYNLINEATCKFKLSYYEQAIKLRSLCTNIIKETSRIFGLDVTNEDNTSTKINELFNKQTLTNEKIAQFALNVLGIDIEKSFRTKFIKHTDFYFKHFKCYDSIDWTRDGIINKFSNDKIYFNREIDFSKYEINKLSCAEFMMLVKNPISSLKVQILKNFNQKFLSYLVHDEPDVDVELFNRINSNKNNLSNNLFNDFIKNPTVVFRHTYEYINFYLITLINVKFDKKLDITNYIIDFDLFNINNYKVLNYLSFPNNVYTLFLVEVKDELSTKVKILLQFDLNDSTKDENLRNNISHCLDKISSIVSLYKLITKDGDSRYMIYEYNIGGYDNSISELSLRTLNSKYQEEEVEFVIESLLNFFIEIHKRKVFIRYIDWNTFFTFRESSVINVKPISIDFSKRERIDLSKTVNNYVPKSSFNISNDLLNNISDSNVAYQIDLIYLIYLVTKIYEKVYDELSLSNLRSYNNLIDIREQLNFYENYNSDEEHYRELKNNEKKIQLNVLNLIEEVRDV